MLPSNLLGIIFALTSAFIWGSGDFTGGYASRRGSQFHVLVLSALSGLVVLIIAALVVREGFPSMQSAVWAMLAGVSGAVGIAALYRGLAIGQAASVAPTAAVISAALPVFYHGVIEGLPDATKLLGFGIAFAGIWMVSATSQGGANRSHHTLLLAVLAGVGFGGFFILLDLVDSGKLFTPLIITRSFTLATGLVLMRLSRLPLPSIAGNPPALLAGVLDAGGNLFYLLALQLTSLDIAAVLASLYPAATVLLASVILKERVTRSQWLGVVVCLAAIVLITL